MSKRRALGDRVWLEEGAGFGGPGTWATIMTGNAVVNGEDLGPWNDVQDDGTSEDYCCLQMDHPDFPDACKDPECREWANLATDDGHFRYHVSECRMHDGPPKNEAPPVPVGPSTDSALNGTGPNGGAT